jgi:hypothetical protein
VKVIFRPLIPIAQPQWAIWVTEHISRNHCHVSLTDSHCRWAPEYSGSILRRLQAADAYWFHCKAMSSTLENVGEISSSVQAHFLPLMILIAIISFPLFLILALPSLCSFVKQLNHFSLL